MPSFVASVILTRWRQRCSRPVCHLPTSSCHRTRVWRKGDGCASRAHRAQDGGFGSCLAVILPDATRGCYYQRYLPGEPCSAVFVAAVGSARLLGVTRQLIGQSGLGGESFLYTGSIGPLQLTSSQRQQWQYLGDCLSAGFSLRGLFGVDAIDTGEAIVPVEVNPRYTASIEVLERSLRWPIVAWHVQACREARLPEVRSPTSVGCSGKAIVYAVKRCRWTGQTAALHATVEARRLDGLLGRISPPSGLLALSEVGGRVADSSAGRRFGAAGVVQAQAEQSSRSRNEFAPIGSRRYELGVAATSFERDRHHIRVTTPSTCRIRDRSPALLGGSNRRFESHRDVPAVRRLTRAKRWIVFQSAGRPVRPATTRPTNPLSTRPITLIRNGQGNSWVASSKRRVCS